MINFVGKIDRKVNICQGCKIKSATVILCLLEFCAIFSQESVTIPQIFLETPLFFQNIACNLSESVSASLPDI